MWQKGEKMSNEMRIDMDKAREKFMDGRYSTKAWQNFYEIVSACAISEGNKNNTPQIKGKGLILFTQYTHCVDDDTHPFQREPLVLRAGDIISLREWHEKEEYYSSLKGKFDEFDATVTVITTQYGDYKVAESLEDVLRVWAEAL